MFGAGLSVVTQTLSLFKGTFLIFLIPNSGYVGLAKEDYQQKDFEQALNHIKLGLAAQATNAELLKLAAEHEQRVAAANKKPSAKTEKKQTNQKHKPSANNGLQKFWKKLWGN